MLIFDRFKYYIFGLAAISIIAGLVYYRHSIIVAERERVNKEWETRENIAQLAASKKLIEKNLEIANKQAKLEEATKIILRKNRETEEARNEYNNLVDKYRSGDIRLRVPTYSDSSDRTGNDSNSTTSRGASQQTCELLPEISEEVLSFAREYKNNLQQLNSLIDLYNETQGLTNSDKNYSDVKPKEVE